MGKQQKLTPVPEPRRKAPKGGSSTAPPRPAPPDLSKIAEQLRPLAVPIGDLQFDPANARLHPEKNLDALRGSLAVYGQCKPVVARKDTGVVIAGNGTLQAALSLGWTHLAAVYVTMDAATAAGYSIADNRSSDLAEWDKDALDKLLREVGTGCDERLDQMLSDLAASEKLIPADDPDPKPPDPEPDPDTQSARITCPQCGHTFDGTIKASEEGE